MISCRSPTLSGRSFRPRYSATVKRLSELGGNSTLTPWGALDSAVLESGGNSSWTFGESLDSAVLELGGKSIWAFGESLDSAVLDWGVELLRTCSSHCSSAGSISAENRELGFREMPGIAKVCEIGGGEMRIRYEEGWVEDGFDAALFSERDVTSRTDRGVLGGLR